MPCCSLCKKEDDNPVEFGEFMKKSNITVHYYCVLLSTHLPQNGIDSSGILGFLVRDIRNEIIKSQNRNCCYCNQPHATLCCFKCKQYFHNICGNQNNCVSEFCNDFRSYCHNHVPFRREGFLRKTKPDCWICHESLNKFNPIHSIRAYCCQNGYVHRSCMRKYALSAGYRLICLWCTNKSFRDDVRKHGVFVPDREATWDNNETLRYTDLHRGYSHCDAKTCLCPQGREYFSSTRWKLIVCCICGASGIHDKCGILVGKNYTCEVCCKILLQTERDKNRSTVANVNSNLNSTMFIPKTFKETADLLQVIDCNQEELGNSDEEPSPENKKQLQENEAQNDQNDTHPEAEKTEPERPLQEIETRNDETSLSLPSVLNSCTKSKPKVEQLFLFGGKNLDVIGTVKVEEDKLEKNSNKLECKEEDVLEFSTSNKTIEAIFSEIESEGRSLDVDMVDEVFDRYKLWLETFG